MKNFLKRNWGKILLAILLITISIISFKTGYSYLSNDNYSPDLNPLLTIERSLQSPAWRSYRVLGFASESEQADIFRSALYYILDLFLPTWSLSQIFALLCFVVGSWFTALLASNLVKDSKQAKYSELVFLLSGIFYISTLWTVWVYYQNMFPYITQFGFLPLLIWSIYRYIKEFNWKNAFILFISSMLFTSTFVIATLFVVDILVVSFFVVLFAIFYSKNVKEIFKKSILTILLFISTQLFWILPFVHYTVNVSGDIVNSHVNRNATTSIIDLEKEALGPLDSARLYTRVLETTDDSEGEKYLFENARDYLTYDFFKFAALIPAIFATIGLVFLVIKKRWIYIPFFILTFAAWFIIKNQNSPLGGIYIFFQENIPLFKQIFRWPSSKIGQIYLYSITILASMGFVFLIDFLTSFFKKKFIRHSVWFMTLITLFSTLCLFSSYLFQGDLFVPRGQVSIPQEYYNLEEYLSENDSKGRILYLPTANNGYFREYDWGFIGSGFLHYIIPNPLMDMSLSIGSKVGEEGMWELRNLELAHDIEGITDFIEKYEVEYILIDRNLIKGRYGYELDWTTSDILSNELELLWKNSDISLYKTSLEEYRLVESLSVETDTFTKEFGKSPALKPLGININNWEIVDDNLDGRFQYLGDNTDLTLTYKDIELNKLPSAVILENNQIIIRPAIPTINNIQTGINKKFEVNNYDIYIVDDKVFTREDLSKGVVVETNYSDLNKIEGVNNYGWTTEDITKYIANNGKSGDCGGAEFEKDISVELQGLASGFSISGESELPCMYSSIKLPETGIVKININWEEVTEDTYIGYCLYSQQHGECVNDEKYIYSDTEFGEKEILLPKILNKNDDTTLTIYAYSPTLEDVEVVFRDIEISTNNNLSRLNLMTEEEDFKTESLSLIDKEIYTVNIPLIYGESSYIYLSSQKENLIWQINEAEKNTLLEVKWDQGIKQIVQGQYLNQYTTLFDTASLDNYLWYWSGQNIRNIPSTLCLTYTNDDKCWVDDIFVDNKQSSALNFFKTVSGNRLDLSYRSVSFADVSENVLHDLVVMKYPEEWNNIEFVPDLVTKYTEYELESRKDTPHSSTYSLYDQLPNNSLISIPQSSSNGWIAISLKNGIPSILKNRVVINGWKQGWDISEVDYDSVYVIYYPNLLAYLGYLIWISVFVLIMVKLIKRKNER